MAFTLTTIAPDPLGSTIISDTSVGTAVQVPITSAHSLYQIHIDNTANTGTAAYLNCADLSSGASNATIATHRFYCAAGATATYIIETGLVQQVGLSYWCVTAATDGSSAAPGSAVSIKILI